MAKVSLKYGLRTLYNSLSGRISPVEDAVEAIGTSSEQASESGSTLFSVLKWVKDKVVSIYNAITDGTNGLAAIKNSAASAATDAAAAKSAAQAITGYATESNATTNKNAILAKFPELLNAIKDYIGIANTDDGEGGSFDALTATEVKTAAAEVWASVWGEVLHTASEDLPLDPYGNIIEEEESESSSESV